MVERLQAITRDLAARQPGLRGWRSLQRGYACIEASGHDAVELHDELSAIEQRILRVASCRYCYEPITWERDAHEIDS